MTFSIDDDDVVGGEVEFVVVLGTDSDDVLNGLGGGNIISGFKGNDTLTGGLGDDILIGGLGNDSLDGGADTDTVSYASASGAVTVDLSLGIATGAAGNDTLTNIENILGSDHDDTLSGDMNNNTIEGGDGADDFIFDFDEDWGVDHLLDFDASDIDELVLLNLVGSLADNTDVQDDGSGNVEVVATGTSTAAGANSSIIFDNIAFNGGTELADYAAQIVVVV